MTDLNFDIFEGPYLRDILDQPSALADTITSLAPLSRLVALRDELHRGARQRIVLTGMGGSYQVLHPLFFRLTQAGFDVIMVETSELLHTAPRLLALENIVIAVSQSGASAEIVRLLEQRNPRPFIIGVTNTPGSPLARGADLTLLTRAGEEACVSCKTSVTALVALEWLAEHWCGGELETLRADLAALPLACAQYLTPWKEHVCRLRPLLEGVRSFFAVGRGRSLTAAMLGGMIQKEAAHVHGEGMSSAGFRHGPYEMLSADVFVMVFDGDRVVSAMNRKLLRDLRREGARGALVGWEETEAPFLLPAVPERVRPVLELLPPQMVSLALAGWRGRQPARFERITKVTAVE